MCGDAVRFQTIRDQTRPKADCGVCVVGGWFKQPQLVRGWVRLGVPAITTHTQESASTGASFHLLCPQTSTKSAINRFIIFLGPWSPESSMATTTQTKPKQLNTEPKQTKTLLDQTRSKPDRSIRDQTRSNPFRPDQIKTLLDQTRSNPSRSDQTRSKPDRTRPFEDAV